MSAADAPADMAIVPRLLARRLLRSRPPSAPVVSGTDGSAPPPGLSVVMACHDECEQLAGCLSHLAGLADELVVVDAASSDGSAELAGRLADRVILTTNKPMLEIDRTSRWPPQAGAGCSCSTRMSASRRACASRCGRWSIAMTSASAATGCPGATTSSDAG